MRRSWKAFNRGPTTTTALGSQCMVTTWRGMYLPAGHHAHTNPTQHEKCRGAEYHTTHGPTPTTNTT